MSQISLPGLPRRKAKKLNVGVIIQARMTSQRFPGKSMALLGSVPVLQRVWEKAQQIRPVDKVVVAVPDAIESEPMEQLIEGLGGEGFRGDETDVLARIYHCANFYCFDVVVRITGDCPFLNPRVSSEVLQLLLWRKLDYVSNVFPVRTYPKGLDTEAMTYDALEAAFINAESPYDREHVTPWLQRTKGIRRACVQQNADASRVDWCVDKPEDIARLESIMAEGSNESKTMAK